MFAKPWGLCSAPIQLIMFVGEGTEGYWSVHCFICLIDWNTEKSRGFIDSLQLDDMEEASLLSG